jgi:hypothetical protein
MTSRRDRRGFLRTSLAGVARERDPGVAEAGRGYRAKISASSAGGVTSSWS